LPRRRAVRSAHPARLATLAQHLPDEAATLALGARLAATLAPGLVIHLSGDLGAGKTTLVRGLLAALGHRSKVKSPTYTLVELYTLSSLDLYHFDFYRLQTPDEWQDAGFRDHFGTRAVALVEWPERAGTHAPAPDLHIGLATHGRGRDATLVALSERGRACIDRLPSGAGSRPG
jgi:tRNA threonylcarbamoyladenosine biosynthesis protein TsaE